ncbi:MAG TPA: polysaccharide deacetylase family protein, partial [Bacteroidales bacterium]|nr:polysaccharide deacetylase family protein [Bacteroidales bacterium]
MKAVTVPAFLRIFYPSLLWQMPAGNQTLYLTFDDGPHPEITTKVLDMLDHYQARATFFCVGENV